MNDTKQRWEKGLAVMHAQQRAKEAPQRVPAGKRGRPGARRMVHEALHAALMGFGEKLTA